MIYNALITDECHSKDVEEQKDDVQTSSHRSSEKCPVALVHVHLVVICSCFIPSDTLEEYLLCFLSLVFFGELPLEKM